MQEETEVLGENLRGQVWIENQIHIRLWPDWESNPGRIGERHGNNRCANLPAPHGGMTTVMGHKETYLHSSSWEWLLLQIPPARWRNNRTRPS